MAASSWMKVMKGSETSRLFYTQIRTHVRFQSRNPREPFFERKRMLEVCKPIYPKDNRPPWLRCGNVELKKDLIDKIQSVHPYHKLLAKEMQNRWDEAGMICFYHVNPIGEEEKKLFRNTLAKEEMNLTFYDKTVIDIVIRGTKYEPIMHLFPINGAILFCKDLIQIKKLITLNKKAPKFLLMGGLVEDRLLSVDNLVQLSSIPNIDYARGQLVSVLSHVGGAKISSLLGQHQLMLSLNLDQRKLQLSKNQESKDKDS